MARIAYPRTRAGPALHPCDARQALPDDPYSLGKPTIAADCLRPYRVRADPEGGQRPRPGEDQGAAQLQGIADDLAGWAGGPREEGGRDAGERPPAADVIMMQGDGRGIAMRPEYRRNAGTGDGRHQARDEEVAEIVAVADFTLVVREQEDIAAQPKSQQGAPRTEDQG